MCNCIRRTKVLGVLVAECTGRGKAVFVGRSGD